MMSSLFPQWMPAWAQAVLLVGGMLFTLLWMLVPFAVFGVKGRLDNLAIQLDDLQAELRVLALGLNAQATQPPAVAEALADRAPPPPAEAPVWEPAPPAPSVERDRGGDAPDIPAYERRPPRAQPASPPAPPPPSRPVEPASMSAARTPVEEDGWPPPSRGPSPAQPYVPRRPVPSHDAGAEPGLAEWSREPVRPVPRGVPAARPVRASVWPPERRARAEPTLRWPPRPE
ncbi:hypothetical protein HNW77_06330 [Komagataeibacter sp. AV436]|uniref:Uncharacterized protein n=1 Tax=Komagataeibacter melomenusus TaxID=2766578 RepID=A0ABX2ACS7_9PROT|nr:hypothetical protein [Komagataeibacter melomenusus]MBV1829931.1 hypothetical protein [Komagataeibacter melomenusus]NPC66010.1 hypothetical protein [Komagataeibacter melomenusus]